MIYQATLSTLTYDPQGFIPLTLETETTGLRDMTRRATVVETLDGGAVLDDMGMFDAARVITLIVRVSDDDAAILETMCRVYSNLHLALDTGLFLVVPLSIGRTPGVVSLNFTILEKLSL